MMKKALFAAMLGAMMVSCGGTGDNNLAANPYARQWVGTWVSSTQPNNGTISMKILADGSISGTMITLTDSGILGGTITRTGTINMINSFDGGGNMTITGQAVLNNGRLIGSFTYTIGGNSFAGSFDAGAGTGT
jgi:hypothetical protein